MVTLHVNSTPWKRTDGQHECEDQMTDELLLSDTTA
jgi:hypothetical protein